MNQKSWKKVGVAFIFSSPLLMNGISFAVPATPPMANGPQTPLPASDKILSQGFADIVAPLTPAVVNISTTMEVKRPERAMELPQFPKGSPFEDLFKDFTDLYNQEQKPRKVTSLGSGFIIDPSGYVVTNNHVIADAEQIKVTLNDGTELNATLVGKDQRTDIALLKVSTSKSLPYVMWGDDQKSRVGDWVIAIGNPFGLGGTVTQGIISSLGRDISSRSEEGMSGYTDYIQIDAPINLGNSGGPMFNILGQVIGVNTAIFSPTGGSVGVGFAVPSTVAKVVVNQLKQYGKTRRGWMGVAIKPLDKEIAESLGLPKMEGALVGRVIPNGPAAKAKIEMGDVILKIAGTPITEDRKLPRIVGELKVGETVPVVVWRKDKKTGKYGEITVQVTIKEYEEAEEAGLLGGKQPLKEKAINIQKVLGMSLISLSPAIRQKYDFSDNTRGILITGVDPDSMAAEKGIREGDIIVDVSQEEVNSPEDLQKLIQQAKKDGRRAVLLLISRQNDLFYVSLRIEEPVPGRGEKK